MADYRIKAQKTGPRTFLKELQMISYRGSSLFTESGSPLIAEKEVYYPPDYLASNATSVVVDPESYEEDGLSVNNKFSKGRPAALPIEEIFKEQSEVSRSLLGVNRAETQQGLFGNVSSYGLEKKDWVAYAAFPDANAGNNWEFKNSPAGPHDPTREFDDPKNSSIVLNTYPAPYTNPGSGPATRALNEGSFEGPLDSGFAKYLTSIVGMLIIEHMVNTFSEEQLEEFHVSYVKYNYPLENGKFNRLYWDRIWTDINQRRTGRDGNIPRMPLGEFRNFGALSAVINGEANPEYQEVDLTDSSIYGLGASTNPDLTNVSNYFGNFFAGSTRYQWTEPNKGHYRIKTNDSYQVDPQGNQVTVWSEYWDMDYDLLPQDLKDWEFRVLESEPGPDSPEVKYKLPYYLITDTTNGYDSLIFGSSWPARFSDTTIPQVFEKISEGNIIGGRPSNYAIQTLQSARAFRYQPGRISGFTYGVRVSEEGAGPGTILEFGVENYSDGYFFRLKDGTDFSIVRRSTVSLGQTEVFTEAGYIEREAYVNRLTGRARYVDELSATEIQAQEDQVRGGDVYLIYETVIEQNTMNGDGLNNQGPTGYIYNPDTVTMYKIEFGWYGAIGARFYAYIPSGSGGARWVTLHTLVIENQLGQPCLEDPYFFFKYRVWTDAPEAIRLPQFVEKYGASYYIDGGDEGTVTIGSGNATNRPVRDAVEADYDSEGVSFPVSKWGTVLGLKPRKKIINSVGNEFFNKKEIYPVSMSITSNKNVELKFVTQYGCQEHAHTFQEGFRCILPESQRLRAKVQIKRFEENESVLDDIGRTEDPCPTLTWNNVSSEDSGTYHLTGGTAGGGFIGWNAFNGGLYGSKIIADKVYQAYINPEENPLYLSGDSNTTVIARNPRNETFPNTVKEFEGYSYGSLLFNYKDPIDVKISPFRRDTTIVSTVPVDSDEFYILFTSTTTGSGFDTYEEAVTGMNYEAVCADGNGRCDGRNIADYQVGIIWPYGDAGTVPAYTYPKWHIHASQTGENFGILMPNNTTAQAANWTNKDVELAEDGGTYYVRDKQIPDSDNFRYYEGLPIDFEHQSLASNRIIATSTGWIVVGNALEIGEGVGNDLGIRDRQQPGVPGADGGRCRAIYVKAGKVTEEALFVDDSGALYVSKSSSWDKGLQKAGEVLTVEDLAGAVKKFTVNGSEIEKSINRGGLAAVKEFWLPISQTGDGAFADEDDVIVKYSAVAMYEPSLLSDTARVIDQKITGQAFPIKVFIKMREGADIGSVVIAKKTDRGLVTQPFTPHGCTVSVSDSGTPDTHNGGGITSNAATKSIGVFSHPGVLNPSTDYSYLDFSQDIDNPVDNSKKCYSFLSPTALDGAGFSGTGDYPLRFLKFKDSGDPVGAFYVTAGRPQELSLDEIFNYNGESVTPSFWNNRALFMIARDISGTDGDPKPNTDGKLSVTLNYKEQ